MDEPSIVDTPQSISHLLTKRLVDWFVFANGIPDGFQSEEMENPPDLVEPV